MSPTYGYVTKLFLESEFQYQGNKQTKKREFWAKSCNFLAETDSENKIIYNYTEKDKNVWTKLSSLGQEPTFKLFLAKILSYIFDCQLMSNMLLTVLAVNRLSMRSGVNAKTRI